METGKDQGYYIDHVFTVGEDGITLELLDYLQATDNSEVQNREVEERNRELLKETMKVYAKRDRKSVV